MITQEQLKDIQERAEALARYLDIDRKKMEYEEEDLRTQAPDFWDNPERARAQMKVVGELINTLKTRRPVIIKNYAEVIEKMYEE